MREIKGLVAGKGASAHASVNAPETPPGAVSMPSAGTPPFEPDMFAPNWGQDRRRHFRLRCFVAVELRVDQAEIPIWGNLANTSTGGCLVETASAIRPDAKLEVGLWVASARSGEGPLAAGHRNSKCSYRCAHSLREPGA